MVGVAHHNAYVSQFVESDGVSRSCGPTGDTIVAQDPVALVVVEVLLAGLQSIGSRPTCQATQVVIAELGTRLHSWGTTLPTAGIGGATRHVAHGVVAGVLIGHAAYVRGGMHMRGISIDHRPRVAADHAIDGIVGVHMRIPRGGAASGHGPTVICSYRRSIVASPGETTQGIITEGLGVGGAAPCCSGHGGGGLQHVADIIQGARQTPQGRTGSGDGGAAADRSLDAIVAECGTEHGRWDAGFGSITTNGKARELACIGVADLSTQERNGCCYSHPQSTTSADSLHCHNWSSGSLHWDRSGWSQRQRRCSSSTRSVWWSVHRRSLRGRCWWSVLVHRSHNSASRCLRHC